MSVGYVPSAVYPASGYATTGSAAMNALLANQYKAQPAAGSAPATPPGATPSAAYNPDVNFTTFWSEYNGFTLTTCNATFMRVDFYLVN